MSHVLARDPPPPRKVLKMNARDVWLGNWACVIVMLAAPPAADAQCVRDVYLAVGGSSPVLSSSGSPAVVASDPSPAALQNPPAADVVRVSEAQILALPATLIVTATDWTPVSRFEGPLLRDVLKLRPGASGDLHVFALNQYAVTLPMSDLDTFAPILAHTRDGVRLKRSDFGPLFIVYPRDQFKALAAPNMAARMVWQVCRIDVQ